MVELEGLPDQWGHCKGWGFIKERRGDLRSLISE